MATSRAEKVERRGGWPLALVVAVVAVAYAGTLTCGFVWDDLAHVADNPAIERVRDALGYFGRAEGRYYRPFVFLTYALDHAVWGRSAAGFHLTNLLLQALNVILLFSVAVRTGVPRRPALLAAALFGVHPLQSEAVAYVSGRTDLIVTAAALVAWRALLAEGRTSLRAAVVAVAVAAAVLAKESGYALVLFLPWAAGSRAGGRREVAKLALPGLTVAAFLLLLRPTPFMGTGFPDGLLRHLAGVGLGLLRYIGLCVWPARLSVDRLTLLPESTLGGALGIAVLVVTACLFAIALRRGSRPVADWSVWTAAFYLPVSNLLPLYPAVADRALFTPEHNLYAPLAGVAVLLGVGLCCLATSPARGRVIAAAAVLVVAALAVRTAVRCADWQSEEDLFAAAVRDGSRSPRVRYNLGTLRLERGETASAARLFEEAVRLAPGDAAIWTNLGVARQRLGDLDAALAAYEEATGLAPRNATIQENLGTLHVARGDFEAARRDFTRALQIDPTRERSKSALEALDRLPPR